MFLCIAVVPLSAVAKGGQALDTALCTKVEPDDGDSFACDGEQIRVLGIDTPEIMHPQHGIFEDQTKGREAAAFTERKLKAARRIVIVRGGRDPFGRTLAHVLLDGELLAKGLIAASLAYETSWRYGDSGLPEYALELREAARAAPRPAFEDPHEWRRRNQRRGR